MSQEKAQRLGEILLQSGIIDQLQLNTALKYQKEWDRKLGEALVELGFISEPTLCKVLSKFLNVPHVELAQIRINPAALQRVPKRLAERYGLIPIEIQGDLPRATLLIAMIDPTNLVAIDEVAFTSGCKVKPVVATHSEIEKSIRRHYGDERVVDVFFESPVQNLSAPNHFGDLDQLVQQPNQVKEKSKPPLLDKTPEPINLKMVSLDKLTRSLLSLLLKKGFITEAELKAEVQDG